MDKEKLKEEYEAEFTYLDGYGELFEWFWHHMEKLQNYNEAINHELKELLAILHGDGGHYQEKHGTLKAIIDAKELINKGDKNLNRPYIRDWLNSYAIKNGYESISHAIGNSISIEDDIAMLIENYYSDK